MRTKSDFKSDVMGFNIRNHIQQQTGKCPFIIMGNLHREKVDLNRDDNATNYEATFNEEIPKQVYKDYHGNITAVTQRLKNQFGHVFLVALHGYINDTKGVNWTALGMYT